MQSCCLPDYRNQIEWKYVQVNWLAVLAKGMWTLGGVAPRSTLFPSRILNISSAATTKSFSDDTRCSPSLIKQKIAVQSVVHISDRFFYIINPSDVNKEANNNNGCQRPTRSTRKSNFSIPPHMTMAHRDEAPQSRETSSSQHTPPRRARPGNVREKVFSFFRSVIIGIDLN